jgi:hypothetical protein
VFEQDLTPNQKVLCVSRQLKRDAKEMTRKVNILVSTVELGLVLIWRHTIHFVSEKTLDASMNSDLKKELAQDGILSVLTLPVAEPDSRMAFINMTCRRIRDVLVE